MKTFKTVDAYIKSFPPKIQKELKAIRKTIRQAVPQASQAIKWGMPTFILEKNLVHFAAFKKHIGFFPGPRIIARLKKELTRLETSKGTIRLPYDKALPHALIRKIAKLRAKDVVQGAPQKKPRRKAKR